MLYDRIWFIILVILIINIICRHLFCKIELTQFTVVSGWLVALIYILRDGINKYFPRRKNNDYKNIV